MLAPGSSIPSAQVILPSLETIDLAQYALGQPTVWLFFPAAFTRVCTTELCTFRDSLSDYDRLGARVVGLSIDTPYSLQIFAQQLGVSYPLLSDFNREAIRAFDVVLPELRGLREVARRAAFVSDAQGIIHYVWAGEVPATEPPYQEIAQAVSQL
jgi:peroxiredoxin